MRTRNKKKQPRETKVEEYEIEESKDSSLEHLHVEEPFPEQEIDKTIQPKLEEDILGNKEDSMETSMKFEDLIEL